MQNSNTPSPSSPKLLDQVRDRIRAKHYSIRTETQYVQWVKRFILFHGKRHPREMGAAEVEAFLTHLAVEGNVAASTQNQALSALLFLYREVLQIELPWLDNVVRAKRPQRLPVVLTRNEVRAVLDRMTGVYGLMASILYGTGMRLMECVRLRVKDVEFERGEILIRDGKGAKDRVTMCRGRWRRSCRRICSSAARCLKMMPGKARRRCICLTPWRKNIRMRRRDGAGSMFFLRVVFRLIHAAVLSVGTIWTRSCCSGR